MCDMMYAVYQMDLTTRYSELSRVIMDSWKAECELRRQNMQRNNYQYCQAARHVVNIQFIIVLAYHGIRGAAAAQ